MIETKHLVWTFQWALEKCHESLTRIEDDIIRLERFGDTALLTSYGVAGGTAAERAEFLHRYRREMIELHAWLSERLLSVVEIDSQQWAEEFFRQRKESK